MAIRSKNIDQNVTSMKRHAHVRLGDVTADITLPTFVSPTAVIIDEMDYYITDGHSANTSETIYVVPRLATDSDSTLQRRGTSASGDTTDDFSANARYRLSPSANNSLTAGTLIVTNFSAVCAVISNVMCHITYRVKDHTVR